MDGWWIYEVCLGKHVRQFHKNADNSLAAEFFLGFNATQELQGRLGTRGAPRPGRRGLHGH